MESCTCCCSSQFERPSTIGYFEAPMHFAGFGFCFKGGISVSFRHIHSSSSTEAEHGQPAPRITNIPVDFTEADKEATVNCPVRPKEGINEPQGAAALVQAWYRGYLVRRTQPLVQLREIHDVKSELREWQAKLSDTDFINRAQQDPKVRMWFTESVMALLLRLDAIQGSHPFVREIRKALTKEVINCQDEIETVFSLGN